MKTRNSTYNRRVNPALRFMAAFMLLFAFSFTACSGTLFKNLLKSLDRIEVSPGLVNIANGTTTQLTATAIFSDNTKTDITSQVTWESANSNIATVSSSGLVAAKLKGQTVTVTATYKGLQSTATVNVTNALLISLQV